MARLQVEPHQLLPLRINRLGLFDIREIAPLSTKLIASLSARLQRIGHNIH
jgi:hypothetical protein